MVTGVIVLATVVGAVVLVVLTTVLVTGVIVLATVVGAVVLVVLATVVAAVVLVVLATVLVTGVIVLATVVGAVVLVVLATVVGAVVLVVLATVVGAVVLVVGAGTEGMAPVALAIGEEPSARMLTTVATRSLKRVGILVHFYPFRRKQTRSYMGRFLPTSRRSSGCLLRDLTESCFEMGHVCAPKPGRIRVRFDRYPADPGRTRSARSRAAAGPRALPRAGPVCRDDLPAGDRLLLEAVDDSPRLRTARSPESCRSARSPRPSCWARWTVLNTASSESSSRSLADLTDGGFVLYDLFSSYVQERCCPLALGHSRAGNPDKPQINWGWCARPTAGRSRCRCIRTKPLTRAPCRAGSTRPRAVRDRAGDPGR